MDDRASALPPSTRLVLRERTRADPQEVLIAGIEDLVGCGAWVRSTRRRALARSQLIAPSGAAAQILPEPLRHIDGLLRRVPGDQRERRELRAAAHWVAQNARMAGTRAVHNTIDELLQHRFLERTPGNAQAGPALVPTPSGRRELAALAPPAADPAAQSWAAATWTAGYAAGRAALVGRGLDIPAGNSIGYGGG